MEKRQNCRKNLKKKNEEPRLTWEIKNIKQAIWINEMICHQILADFEPLDVDVNRDVVDLLPSAVELLRQLEQEQQQEDEDDFYGTGSF